MQLYQLSRNNDILVFEIPFILSILHQFRNKFILVLIISLIIYYLNILSKSEGFVNVINDNCLNIQKCIEKQLRAGKIMSPTIHTIEKLQFFFRNINILLIYKQLQIRFNLDIKFSRYKLKHINIIMGCHQAKIKQQNIEAQIIYIIQNLSQSITYSQPIQTKNGLVSHIAQNNMQGSEYLDSLIKKKEIMIESGFIDLEGFSQRVNFSRKQVLFERLQQIF
ncbi:hypothetical protein pb186bvf_012292 [Paramecium bursaria]